MSIDGIFDVEVQEHSRVIDITQENTMHLIQNKDVKPLLILKIKKSNFKKLNIDINNIGYTIIKNYGDKKFYCFDDLCVEPTRRHFGKHCNEMGEIIIS